MILQTEKKALIPQYHYTDRVSGRFGIYCDGRWTGWQSCREVTQLYYKLDNPGFWFTHESGEMGDVIEFMTWVERTLCLPERSKAYSEPVSVYSTYIEPAPFWRSSEMRKNVLTMLLRVGFVYGRQTAKNPFQAIKDGDYSKSTVDALDRFLMGFTHYVGPAIKLDHFVGAHIKAGWYSTFCGKDTDYIRKNLVSPVS